MEDCACVAYHTACAAEALKSLTRGRFAVSATHCSACGRSYWSWLDPTEMSTFRDAMAATRTKDCSNSELRSIVDEMVERAGMSGISRGQIRVNINRFSPSGGKRWWELWK